MLRILFLLEDRIELILRQEFGIHFKLYKNHTVSLFQKHVIDIHVYIHIYIYINVFLK